MRRVINSLIWISGILLALLSAAGNATASASSPYEQSMQAIASDLSQHNTESFNKAVDADAILDKTFDNLILDSKLKSSIRSSLKKAIQTKVANAFMERIPAGGYVKLLKIRPVGNQMVALVRFDFGENGSGYYDMHLARSAKGSIRIIDWYDYSYGQTYSQNLRQLIAMLAPTPTLLGQVFDIASNRKKTIDDIAETIKLFNEKQHGQVVRKVLSMDEDMRKNRLLAIIATQSGNLSNDEKLYHKALANLEKYYRDDPSMAFMLIDYYFLEQKFDSVLSATNQLLNTFGVEDAALYAIKSNALAGKGHYSEAASVAEHAITIEPEYENNYWSLLNASAKAKNYAKAVEAAKALENRFSYELGPEALSQDGTYAALVQSAEYKKWRNTKK